MKNRRLSVRLNRLALSLLLTLAGMTQVSAQNLESQQTSSDLKDKPQAEPENAVEITAVRDPAIMPYQKAYQMMTRLNALDLQDLRLSLRVLDAKSRKAVPDLQISLEGKESRQKLKISETGEVVIPLDAKAYEEGAEFIANKKRHSLIVDIQLFPILPGSSFSFHEVQAATNSATRALREIVPWYYRLFLPNPKGVAICYADTSHQVELRGQQTQQIAADQKLTDSQEKTVYCAKLAAGTLSEASVVPEPGWRAQFY